ncbi:collagen alpha-1(I) chain-like [Malaclemys terrapin pileata]|uniref:collagen alpha-1(I) chain-like n=1 Tax=Malaclemys terrapin pileata TaxID=2991368 RepID=UPI0023A83D3D|nr:collagen alpha-1(I) chain-like [Malaclemys terrapin pileata]
MSFSSPKCQTGAGRLLRSDRPPSRSLRVTDPPAPASRAQERASVLGGSSLQWLSSGRPTQPDPPPRAHAEIAGQGGEKAPPPRPHIIGHLKPPSTGRPPARPHRAEDPPRRGGSDTRRSKPAPAFPQPDPGGKFLVFPTRPGALGRGVPEEPPRGRRELHPLPSAAPVPITPLRNGSYPGRRSQPSATASVVRDPGAGGAPSTIAWDSPPRSPALLRGRPGPSGPRAAGGPGRDGIQQLDPPLGRPSPGLHAAASAPPPPPPPPPEPPGCGMGMGGGPPGRRDQSPPSRRGRPAHTGREQAATTAGTRGSSAAAARLELPESSKPLRPPSCFLVRSQSAPSPPGRFSTAANHTGPC